MTIQQAVSPPRQRLEAIDAARGFAMLLACLAHIKDYLGSHSLLYELIAYPTRIGTPTFLLLSGFIIGHLSRADPQGKIRLTLLDRGIFLLTIVHLLFGLVDLPRLGVSEWLFGRTFITDVYGLGLLLAILLRSASTATLATLGVAACLGSWIAVTMLPVPHGWALRAGGMLIDMRNHTGGLVTSAPLVPYTGIFILGMALSRYLKPSLAAQADRETVRRLTVLGISCFILLVAAVFVWHIGKAQLMEWIGGRGLARTVRATLDITGKRPPSPGYLLFYGGAALLMLGLLWRLRLHARLQPFIAVTSTIGRASLMCFVVQDWLLINIPVVAGFSRIHSAPFWFAYLFVCVLLLYPLAKAWDAHNWNRYLTVGLKAIAARRADQKRAGLPAPEQAVS